MYSRKRFKILKYKVLLAEVQHMWSVKITLIGPSSRYDWKPNKIISEIFIRHS
jgi:hypothetical protein